jgi:hypothetical protein
MKRPVYSRRCYLVSLAWKSRVTCCAVKIYQSDWNEWLWILLVTLPSGTFHVKVKVTTYHDHEFLECKYKILLILNRCVRRGWVFIFTPWHFYPTEWDPILIVQEAGWVPGLVWTGLEKRKSLASTGFRTQSRSVLSLYTVYDVTTLCDVT